MKVFLDTNILIDFSCQKNKETPKIEVSNIRFSSFELTEGAELITPHP